MIKANNLTYETLIASLRPNQYIVCFDQARKSLRPLIIRYLETRYYTLFLHFFPRQLPSSKQVIPKEILMFLYNKMSLRQMNNILIVSFSSLVDKVAMISYLRKQKIDTGSFNLHLRIEAIKILDIIVDNETESLRLAPISLIKAITHDNSSDDIALIDSKPQKR